MLQTLGSGGGPLTTLMHLTAVVHDGAQLHPTVKVGPYAVIGAHVTNGPGTEIGAHVVIDGQTTIGAQNRIFPGAAIGLESQDLKYDGSMSRVVIGDNNLIREYVTINRATKAGEATLVGNHNMLCIVPCMLFVPFSLAGTPDPVPLYSPPLHMSIP